MYCFSMFVPFNVLLFNVCTFQCIAFDDLRTYDETIDEVFTLRVNYTLYYLRNNANAYVWPMQTVIRKNENDLDNTPSTT
jgi:hypothetical protein